MGKLNGWHHNHKTWANEFWWDGKKIHEVSIEAWGDFCTFIGTPNGRRWATRVVADQMGYDLTGVVRA